ncbi:MAG: hypothetical protein IAA25_03105 [Candidatus Ruminococcus intestinipullorum]|nr:hypothetical protein [Candidatus Ruminococcus intestinipullorum]
MKEIIEEYAGVIAACISGVMLLGVLYLLINDTGELFHLYKMFFLGLGMQAQ